MTMWGEICSKNLKLQNQLQHKRKRPSSLIAQDGWKGNILFSNDLGNFLKYSGKVSTGNCPCLPK